MEIIEGLSSAVSSIMGWLGDFFLNIFFSFLVTPIFKLMDTFIDIMLMLAGVNPLDSSSSDSNLITTFLQSDSISNLYMYIAIFSAVLLILLAIIQIIKQDFFTEDSGKNSHAKVIKKVFLGMVYIVAIPPIFLFAVSVVSQVFELLWNIDGVNQLSSLSQTVFELALSKPEWMIRAELLGESTSATLAPIPHWSVITTEQLTTLTEIYNFNFIIFIGVLGVAFYTMFMLAFAFAKRIFRIVILYAVGPIAIAQSVNDDSKFNAWKKDVIKELISIFGSLISLVIFVIFCTEVNNITFLKDQVSATNTSTIALFNMVIKALFMLVGFSVIKNGDSIFDNVVGGQIKISDGESTFNNIKSAAKSAVAPYKQVGKAFGFAKNTVTGTVDGAYAVAGGIAKTKKMADKNGGLGHGGLVKAIGEVARDKAERKWYEASKLKEEPSYEDYKKKLKSQHEDSVTLAKTGNISEEHVQRLLKGLTSNDENVRNNSLNEILKVALGNLKGEGATNSFIQTLGNLGLGIDTTKIKIDSTDFVKDVSQALQGLEIKDLQGVVNNTNSSIDNTQREITYWENERVKPGADVSKINDTIKDLKADLQNLRMINDAANKTINVKTEADNVSNHVRNHNKFEAKEGAAKVVHEAVSKAEKKQSN